MKHAQTACETFGFLFLSENWDASLDMPESVAEAGQLIENSQGIFASAR